MSHQPTPRPHKCKKCRQIHVRCLAHNRKGQPCGQMPLNGMDVCRSHGPNEAAKAKAAERIQIAQMEQVVRTYGISIEVDATEGIKQEIARTNGAIKWLQDRIGEMDPTTLVAVLEQETSTGSTRAMNYQRQTVRPEVAVLLRMYLAERTHFRRVCRDAISLGIRQKELELQSEELSMYITLLEQLLTHPGLGLSTQKQDEGRRIMGNILLSIPVASAIAS